MSHRLCHHILALLVLALLLPCGQARSEGRNITLGTLPEGWPPFLIPANGSRDTVGIMADVFTEICGNLGLTVSINPSPETRNRILLAEGKLDAYSLSKKWVNAPSDYLWTDPVLEVRDILVYRKDSHRQLTTPEDIKGLNVGVIRGYVYPSLEHLFEADVIHRITTFNTRSLLFMLARHRVDAIVSTSCVAKWIISVEPQLNADDFVFSNRPVDSAPYGFAFAKAKGWEAFIPRFNAELERMRNDGRLDAIFNRYR